jgi:hypothetical protein
MKKTGPHTTVDGSVVHAACGHCYALPLTNQYTECVADRCIVRKYISKCVVNVQAGSITDTIELPLIIKKDGMIVFVFHENRLEIEKKLIRLFVGDKCTHERRGHHGKVIFYGDRYFTDAAWFGKTDKLPSITNVCLEDALQMLPLELVRITNGYMRGNPHLHDIRGYMCSKGLVHKKGSDLYCDSKLLGTNVGAFSAFGDNIAYMDGELHINEHTVASHGMPSMPAYALSCHAESVNHAGMVYYFAGEFARGSDAHRLHVETLQTLKKSVQLMVSDGAIQASGDSPVKRIITMDPPACFYLDGLGSGPATITFVVDGPYDAVIGVASDVVSYDVHIDGISIYNGFVKVHAVDVIFTSHGITTDKNTIEFDAQ